MILELLPRIYTLAKIIKAGMQYRLRLPGDMNNIWSILDGKEVDLIAIAKIENPPAIVEATKGIIPIAKRKIALIRTGKNRENTYYTISLPRELNEVWEEIYRTTGKLEIVIIPRKT
jgi:hypothetical protein